MTHLIKGLSIFLLTITSAFASEAELHIPELTSTYQLFGSTVSGVTLLTWGLLVCVLGVMFGIMELDRKSVV